MRYELTPYNRDATDEDLLADLQRVAKVLDGKKVTTNAYDRHGKYHSSTLQRRFRSWFIALEKAGLPKTRNLNISNDALFDNLAAVWEAIGRQPKYDEIKKTLSQFRGGTYEKRFGSWRKALEAFVNWASEDSKESPDNGPPHQIEEVEDLQCKGENSTRKIKIEAAPREPTLRQRITVFMRDGFRCQACGRSPITHPGTILHADHVEPWIRGGMTSVENLRTLCDRCNLGKGAM